MSKYPQELRYSKSHEWVRKDDENTLTIGITDHAQSLLGDLVFVELPEVDSNISAGDEAAVVESVKTAADVYSPLSGEVIEVNETLTDSPENVNQDPYGAGWLYRIKTNNLDEFQKLLDANAYAESVTEES